MNRIKQFIETTAAMIVASGIIWSLVVGVYSMMDDEFKVATQGWVANAFGDRNAFNTLTTANININYYERKKCEGEQLDPAQHDLLLLSYDFWLDVKKRPHVYQTMTREEICADRIGEQQ